MARSYLPSKVSEIVPIWRKDLNKRIKIAHCGKQGCWGLLQKLCGLHVTRVRRCYTLQLSAIVGGKSALELMTKMFEDGEDDSRAYPLHLDDMLARNLAYRVRFQANCKQASVIKVEDDPEKIQKILEQIEPEEHTSKVDKDKSNVNEDLHFHTQSLSATAEHDPDTLASVTPSKRMSTELQCDGMLSQEVETGQLSSTKLMKQIKTE